MFNYMLKIKMFLFCEYSSNFCRFAHFSNKMLHFYYDFMKIVAHQA